MFVDFDTPAPHRGSWCALPADEALMLWTLRRLVVAWPGAPAVTAALHHRWGDDGLGVLQLLRCWLTGVGRQARRPLTIGDPACALLLPDESAMLAALRDPDKTAMALDGLCGEPGRLAPLAAALSGFLACNHGRVPAHR